jgi:hypothetical protein
MIFFSISQNKFNGFLKLMKEISVYFQMGPLVLLHSKRLFNAAAEERDRRLPVHGAQVGLDD